MKKSFRKKLLCVCTMILGAVAICLAQIESRSPLFIQASDKEPNYDKIFIATEDAVFADNVAVNGVGETGLKVTALKNDAKVDFKQDFFGNFEIDFSIVPLKIGEKDFSSLQFTFTESETGKYFDVCYQLKETEEGLETQFAVKIPHRTARYIVKPSELSFMGEGQGIETFSFNPYNMEIDYVYGGQRTRVVSLKDENLFLSFFNSHETYDSFESYDVSLSFGGMEKESASVIVSSLCGQKLGGAQMENTASAVITDMPVIQNGVVGKPIKLPTDNVRTFDILDGEQNVFKGNIEVKDPLGEAVTVKNNAFVPNGAGEYFITYIPYDQGDKEGQPYAQAVTVYSKSPVISIEYAFALTDGYSLSKNNVLLLPAAKGKSGLINGDGHYETFINVKMDGEEILKDISASENYLLSFPNSGKVEIIYSTSDFYDSKVEEKFSLTVLESGVDFSSLQFNRIQNLGDTVKLPVLSVGETVTYPILRYPDGRSIKDEYAKLDVGGAYCLCYQVDGQEYYIDFSVKQTQKGLFDYDKKIKATDDYLAPDYADANYRGLLLTANANNATAVYNKPVDLSEKTQSDLLLEFFLCPEKQGEYEFECFTITLADAYDETNKIDIKFERETSGGNYHYILYASACANTDGVFSEKKTVVSSFYGKYQKDENYGYYPSQSIRVYFDYSTGRIYLSSLERAVSSKTLLVDLTDASAIGDNHEFKGFTTGECTLSVNFSKLAKKEASVLLLNVDGYELGELSNTDNTAPSIIVDYAGYDKNELPYGIVGNPYKVFDYVSYDVLGFVAYSDVVVYLKKGQEKTYFNVVNGMFVPSKRGVYYLEYAAIDDCGNETVKAVSITVLEEDEVVPPNYIFGEMLESYCVGEEIKIPEGEIENGDFQVTQETNVYFNNKEIDLDANSFLPTKAGTYQIKVGLKTYAKTFIFVKELNVEASETPIISLCTLPQAMLINGALDLTKITAKEYLKDGVSDVPVSIKVNGEIISDKIYVPTSVGEKTIEIIAQGSLNTKTICRTLLVNDPKQTPTFLEGYFYTDNCHVEANSLDYTFNAIEQTTVDFVKPLYSKSVNFEFAISETGEAFEGLNIYLTDSVNEQIKIGVKIIKDETSSGKGIFICDGESRRISLDLFTDTASFSVFYDDETREFTTSKGVLLGKVSKTVEGKEFNGFESGRAYLTFSYTDASLKLKAIANQRIGNLISDDIQGPYIKMKTNLGETLYGKAFQIPAVHVFDVLSEVVESYAEILDDKDNVLVKFTDISKVNEYTLSTYGNYRLIYTVIDSAGKKTSSVEDFEIKDVISPTLHVSGTVATYGICGREMKLPSAAATDNTCQNVSVKIYLILPNGEIRELKEYSFTSNQVGIHTLIYQCEDDEGNSAVKSYKIRIVEAEK